MALSIFEQIGKVITGTHEGVTKTKETVQCEEFLQKHTFGTDNNLITDATYEGALHYGKAARASAMLNLGIRLDSEPDPIE